MIRPQTCFEPVHKVPYADLLQIFQGLYVVKLDVSAVRERDPDTDPCLDNLVDGRLKVGTQSVWHLEGGMIEKLNISLVFNIILR